MEERRHPTPNDGTGKAARAPLAGLADAARAAWKSRAADRVRRAFDFIVYAAARFQRDDGARMASALAYTSLLALVPLLAIALAMLAAFPVFDGVRDQLQALVFEYFVPSVGEAVHDQITRFIGNAAQLTAAGVVGLAVTAVMLLVTIETALNDIFRVATPRSWVSRLLVYWTTLTLGPLLIGASLSLSGYLVAVGQWAADEGYSDLRQWATSAIPTALSMLAFMLLYLAVPNRRVGVKDALVGAVAAGLLFASLRYLFTLYLSNVRGYETLYGAVAVIPIFLIWMYLSWAVVLVGAELTAALPEWRLHGKDVRGPLSSQRRLALGLQTLAVLYGAARGGSGPVSRGRLLLRTAAAEAHLNSILGHLLDCRMVVRARGGRYVLGRDLEAVTLYDLVQALDIGIGLDGAEGPWRSRAAPHVDAADRAEHAALSVSLKEILADS